MSTPQQRAEASLPEAPVSFAIAAIPHEPIYSQIAKASLAITRRCANRNLIDNQRFPCHLSLILSGASLQGIDRLGLALEEANVQPCTATALSIYAARGGFIGVSLSDRSLTDLQEWVLKLVEAVLHDEPVIRPHLQRRWSVLSPSQRALIRRFGTYKVATDFHPHLSVAQVDPDEAEDMKAIAQSIIRVPQAVPFRELQLVNVGHENEQWTVLTRASFH